MSPLNLYLILRSLWAGFFISVVTFLELPFGGIDRPGMNRRLYGWAKRVLDLAQVNLQVEGLENLNMVPGERYVVMCNHASYYDIPLSMQVFKDHCSIRMIAKKELFAIPVWGPAMSRAEFVFIDREDRHQAAKDIERAKGLMETGLVFWIAPEGTRSPDGRLGLFKTGGVKLAMDMGAKIIPLGLEESLLQKDPLGTQVLERHRLKPKGYLLYLGSLSKRKNLFRLVEGYAKSAARKSYRLVLAGELSWGIESLAQKVQDLGLERDLTLLPYLPEADLPALYQGAVGFLYPTLYEGFGLPVLESMAAGTPILVGNLGAAPETAGGHGVLCDPYEAESIAAGIDQLPAFGADRIEAARTHAQSYSWEKTAAATLALYGQVLGRRDR